MYGKTKHKLDKKFIRIITVIISEKFKRALFQYIGKQPMKCKKMWDNFCKMWE